MIAHRPTQVPVAPGGLLPPS